MKRLKGIFWLLLAGFILLNIIAFFHAYKLTHFTKSTTARTKTPDKLSSGQKLGTIVFGVSNPRPENNRKPDVPYQTITLQSNKQIECWLLPQDQGKGTVVLFHGYNGDKSSMLDKAEVFRDLGYSTLLVDFMGSGGSEGNQTTIGFKEAQQVKTCVDYLNYQGEKNIILFGTSLGATAILKALADNKVRVKSVILECPFSTMLSTVENRFEAMRIPAFPMANLLVFWGGVQNGFNGFQHNPEEYAQYIRLPVLLMHGQQDKRVSQEEIQAVYDNLAGPKTFVSFPLAGHENYLTRYKTEWSQAVSQFLE